MSATPRPARVSAAPPRRVPVLSLVTSRETPGRRAPARLAPFLAFLVVLLAAGLLGLLVLNTVLARDAFRLHALKVSGATLQDREQALRREVETLRSPENLATQASALHMIRSQEPPAFLRLSDGAILGTPTTAVAPSPAPGATPGPSPAAAAGSTKTTGASNATGATGATGPRRDASPVPSAGPTSAASAGAVGR